MNSKINKYHLIIIFKTKFNIIKTIFKKINILKKNKNNQTLIFFLFFFFFFFNNLSIFFKELLIELLFSYI